MLTAIFAKKIEDELNSKKEGLPIKFEIEAYANNLDIYYVSQVLEIDTYVKVCSYGIGVGRIDVSLDEFNENSEVVIKWLTPVITVISEIAKSFSYIRDQQAKKNESIGEAIEREKAYIDGN